MTEFINRIKVVPSSEGNPNLISLGRDENGWSAVVTEPPSNWYVKEGHVATRIAEAARMVDRLNTVRDNQVGRQELLPVVEQPEP